MASRPDGYRSDGPSIGVVVPVYNEEAGIEHSCRAIARTLYLYAGRAVLIAVDDGSADGSAVRLARLRGELDVLDVVTHPQNAGYGQALRTGADRAAELGLDYVAFIDSDLTNPPDDLFKIIALADAGHAYIKGSRFVDGGSMRSVPWRRRWVSQLGNVVGAALFDAGVRDVTNGFRGGQTELIRSLNTHERGFAVIVEELAAALEAGVTPVEFPTVLSARSGQQRISAFAYSAAQILSYLRYPLSVRVKRMRGVTRG